MYTVYNDLLINPTQETQKIQMSRDLIINNAMMIHNFPEFPMHEYDVSMLFDFFKEITRQNPILNVVLMYNLNGKDSSCIIIRNNKIHMYPTKQEAFDSIINIEDMRTYSSSHCL
jgi:hypothetical protein